MAKTKNNELILAVEFERCVLRWMNIFANGAGDPGWDDGTNINLVRNHIAYNKEIIEQESEGKLFYEYPKFWDAPVLPEAPRNWMSKGSDRRVPIYCREEDLNFDDSWGREAYKALCAMC